MFPDINETKLTLIWTKKAKYIEFKGKKEKEREKD